MRVSLEAAERPANYCSDCKQRKEPKARPLPLADVKPGVEPESQGADVLDELEALGEMRRIVGDNAFRTAEKSARLLAHKLSCPFLEAVQIINARLRAQQA